MRKLLLASVFAALPFAAQAADLYTSPAPSPTFDYASPKPIGFDWAGFYLGGNAGYMWANNSYLFDTNNPLIRSDTMDREGFIGGGQIGYNFQTGPWVLGAEADIQYSDSSGSVNDCAGPCSTDVEWFGTARLRAGYAFDRLLIYATGGFAYGGIEDKCPSCVPLTEYSDTLTGWTAGGGFEYGFASNWTAKLEYLYMDLGSSDSGRRWREVRREPHGPLWCELFVQLTRLRSDPAAPPDTAAPRHG